MNKPLDIDTLNYLIQKLEGEIKELKETARYSRRANPEEHAVDTAWVDAYDSVIAPFHQLRSDAERGLLPTQLPELDEHYSSSAKSNLD